MFLVKETFKSVPGFISACTSAPPSLSLVGLNWFSCQHEADNDDGDDEAAQFEKAAAVQLKLKESQGQAVTRNHNYLLLGSCGGHSCPPGFRADSPGTFKKRIFYRSLSIYSGHRRFIICWFSGKRTKLRSWEESCSTVSVLNEQWNPLFESTEDDCKVFWVLRIKSENYLLYLVSKLEQTFPSDWNKLPFLFMSILVLIGDFLTAACHPVDKLLCDFELIQRLKWFKNKSTCVSPGQWASYDEPCMKQVIDSTAQHSEAAQWDTRPRLFDNSPAATKAPKFQQNTESIWKAPALKSLIWMFHIFRNVSCPPPQTQTRKWFSCGDVLR